MLEITAVGGYTEIGRNMTAVRYNNDVFILDIGLHVENYIGLQGTDDPGHLAITDLLRNEALPHYEAIEKLKNNVRLIIPSHAHLDHIGGVPFLGPRYNAPVLCTPFTAGVLGRIFNDHKTRRLPSIKVLNVNTSYRFSDEVTVEFINVTHSTPQCAMVVIHTPDGCVVYANDFKLDNFPTLGKKTNIKRLEELGKSGKVRALVIDTTGAQRNMKTPSESVAREMLKDVMISTEFGDKLIVVTTFSSHIARLQSIVKLAKKINRKVIFLGRSLEKYTSAAQECGIADFSDVEIVQYKSQIKRRLKKLGKDRSDYLLIVTGHQGEPQAVLSGMAHGLFPFTFFRGDYVLFSCGVIPTPGTVAQREKLEEQLKLDGVRIFRDLHVSGHASIEEHRDLITLLKPEHILPAHGEPPMIAALLKLGNEMGYPEKTLHTMKEGDTLRIDS